MFDSIYLHYFNVNAEPWLISQRILLKIKWNQTGRVHAIRSPSQNASKRPSHTHIHNCQETLGIASPLLKGTSHQMYRFFPTESVIRSFR